MPPIALKLSPKENNPCMLQPTRRRTQPLRRRLAARAGIRTLTLHQPTASHLRTNSKTDSKNASGGQPADRTSKTDDAETRIAQFEFELQASGAVTRAGRRRKQDELRMRRTVGSRSLQTFGALTACSLKFTAGGLTSGECDVVRL